MEWIRQWVLQIAGVITLCAICDIIMVDGEMKKYVKPILGFVLVFSIIRPIFAFSFDKVKVDILQDSVSDTVKLSQELDEKQKSDIVKIYEQKLSAKIEDDVNIKYNADADVFVTAEREKNRLGDIQQVSVIINVKDGELINTGGIKQYIREEFGVEIDRIKVEIKEKR